MSDADKTKQLSLIVNPNVPPSHAMRTGVAERLYLEAQAIDLEDAWKAGTAGFMGRGLVQATLPYTEPDKSLPVWTRKTGEYRLVVKPGYIEDDTQENGVASVGYPYGSLPRLILAWIGTEAVRTKSPELVLGNRMSEFMQQLGIEGSTGGKLGTITRLRNAMVRLFAADIAVLRADQASIATAKVGIADGIEFWWDRKNAEQASLWKSTITLNDRFYREIVQNPVPIDLRALKALKASPMAIDLYCYLTWRVFGLGEPKTIPWEALQQQFGSAAASEWKFRELFKRNIQKVLAVYPVNVEATKAGLVVKPSHTSVPRASKDNNGF